MKKKHLNTMLTCHVQYLPLGHTTIPWAELTTRQHLNGSGIPEKGGVVHSTQQRGFWDGQHDGRTGPNPKLPVPAGEIMGNTCVSVGVYTGSWLLTSMVGGWMPPQLSYCC